MDLSDFRRAIWAQFKRAENQGRPHVEINAGELYRTLGGYPPKRGEQHRMPLCCQAMRAELDAKRDQVVHETASGQAPSLTIRYKIPR